MLKNRRDGFMGGDLLFRARFLFFRAGFDVMIGKRHVCCGSCGFSFIAFSNKASLIFNLTNLNVNKLVCSIKPCYKLLRFASEIWRNAETPYLCTVFFIVLDLRLIEDWLSGIDSLFLYLSLSLQNHPDSDDMSDASSQAEQVENGMHVGFSQRIEYCACDVGDSSSHQPPESGRGVY